MTNPTLTAYHALYTKARERWPDAPGLPEGFEFGGKYLRPHPVGIWDTTDKRTLCTTAALALCLSWAMEFGAWWERQAIRPSMLDFHVDPCQDGRWRIVVNAIPPSAADCHSFIPRGSPAIFDTHHAAYFAAVSAVVESAATEPT